MSVTPPFFNDSSTIIQVKPGDSFERDLLELVDKKFLAYTKMAPLEYQLALRLRRAANLLANSETPIAKIAKETGFQSPAYFSRFFHRSTGLSPVQYRKRHLETVRT